MFQMRFLGSPVCRCWGDQVTETLPQVQKTIVFKNHREERVSQTAWVGGGQPSRERGPAHLGLEGQRGQTEGGASVRVALPAAGAC